MSRRLTPRLLALALAVPLAAGCAGDNPASSPVGPTSPRVSASRQLGPTASTVPSGERLVGQAAIEPAYNADTGDFMYLLTPINAPLPAKTNGTATSPLYIVEYPPGWEGATLNCAGVPGNCPDHDGEIAGAAMAFEPNVYGSVITAIPGHDHIGDPAGAPDFDVAWEVWLVTFTQAAVDHYGVANLPHLTTDAAIQDAKDAGYVGLHDLGFAFYCSVVSPATYWKAHQPGA